VPTPATAYTTQVGGVASGLDVDSATGRFYLVDSTGVIWTTDAPTGQQRPTLGTPINIGKRQPVDLTIDQSTGYLYISTRVCDGAAAGCILALNGRTGGTVLRSIPLPGAPNQVRVDSDLGLLYVAVPERQALIQVDVRSGNVLNTISGLPQITGLALDSARHTLYASHLGGQVTAIDVPSAQVIARPSMSGAGFTGVATARGLVYGVNTATHELDVLEPVSQAVSRYPLSQEPAAVAASEESGAVYVLSSRSDVILQIDPTSGAEIGRVNMASRSGQLGLSSNSNLQTLQPRIVLNPSNDAVFASLPEQGELAAISNDQFPPIANAIPYVETPEHPLVASIPGVIWPGGDAGPAQPAPILQAQAPDPQPESDGADQEGL
jgi:DNA-binding beta-propeller fold protein YncE